MNWFGSGFIPIIIYAYSSAEAVLETGALLTEDGLNILTEDNNNILVE